MQLIPYIELPPVFDLSIIKSKTHFFFSVKICNPTLKFLKLPQIWNNFPSSGVRKMDELL